MLPEAGINTRDRDEAPTTMALAERLPRFAGAWHRTLREARAEQARTGGKLLLSGRLLEDSGCMSRAFCVAAGVGDIDAFLQKSESRKVELCEIIPTAADLATLRAVRLRPQDPRFFIDVDLKVPERNDEKEGKKLQEILSAMQRTFARLFPHHDPHGEWTRTIIVENSRRAGKTGWKYSWHIITRLIIPELRREGRILAGEVHKELCGGAETEDIAKCIDMAVYTARRNLRIVGFSKKKGDPPSHVPQLDLKDALPYTLITHYDLKDEEMLRVPPMDGAGKSPRGSCSSPSLQGAAFAFEPIEGVEEKDFGDLGLYFRSLTEFLEHHPASRAMNWTGARVNQLRRSQRAIHARVSYPERGQRHLCAAGVEHNGNCSQSWLLRIDAMTHVLEGACWNNARRVACSTPVGQRMPWFVVRNPSNNRPVRIDALPT